MIVDFKNSQENLKCDDLVHIGYLDPFLMDLWNYKILQAKFILQDIMVIA